jgi:hypothetical protein
MLSTTLLADDEKSEKEKTKKEDHVSIVILIE